MKRIDELTQEFEKIELEDIEVHRFINGILQDKEEGIPIDRRNFTQLKGQLRKNKARLRALRKEIKQVEKEERMRNHRDQMVRSIKARKELEAMRQAGIKEREENHNHQFIQSLKKVLAKEFGVEKQYQLFMLANQEIGNG